MTSTLINISDLIRACESNCNPFPVRTNPPVSDLMLLFKCNWILYQEHFQTSNTKSLNRTPFNLLITFQIHNFFLFLRMCLRFIEPNNLKL